MVAQAELGQHVAHVGLDGVLAHVQRRGHLGVGQPPGHQLQGLALAGGEAGKGGQVGVGPGRAAGELLDQAAGDRGASRASPAATTRTAATRSSRGRSLSRNPLAPARRASNTYSSRSKVVRISTRTGSARAGPASRGSPRSPSSRARTDVHQHHVGPEPPGRVDRVQAVGSLAEPPRCPAGPPGSSGTRPGPAPGRRPPGP